MGGGRRSRPVVACALASLLVPSPGPTAVFTGTRHPDTTDERGAYRVRVQVLAGPPLEGGRVHYSVSCGGPRSSGQASLIRASESTFEGRIPGQPRGCAIDYWFTWRAADGPELRHPGRVGTAYRFRIRGSQAPEAARSPESETQVSALPVSSGFVLALAAAGDERWIGYRSGRIWHGKGGVVEPPGAGGALASGAVRFVLVDPVSGAIHAGTDRGLVVSERSGPWRGVHPRPGSEVALPCSGRPCRAGPGVRSPLDGSVLFQMEPPPTLERTGSAAFPLLLRDGVLEPWQPRLVEGELAGLFTLAFDETDGCFLAGAGLESGDDGVRAAVLRRCGDRNEVAWVAPGAPAHGPAFRRVTALARQPRGDALLVATESDPAGGGRHEIHGLYVLAPSGTLEPAAKGSDAIASEITSLMADRTTGRVLVGTFGRGILELRDGMLRPLALPAQVPTEITALAPTQTGGILIGTPAGAFEVLANGSAARGGLEPGEGLPPDALPMDVHPRDGRVLLSSASSGLFELVREGAGWQKAARPSWGGDPPPGRYGDARYGSRGEVGALLTGSGLAEWSGPGWRVIAKEAGLYSEQVLRLLAHDGGGWWLAFAPRPFPGDAGAAVQVVEDGRARLTMPISDRMLATVGGWIRSPDGTVLAATRAGLVQISDRGPLRLRSRDPLSAIARDPGTGAIGAAGSAVGRWDGERMVPVLFGLQGRSSQGPTGDPLDLAIDRSGNWYLLYRDGLIAVLDAQGRLLRLIQPEDGIPLTARRVLAHPGTGEVFVGSAVEGMAVIAPADHGAR